MEANVEAKKILDARAQELFLPNEGLEKLATGAAWSEGPIWLEQDNSVLWSDIPNNRMLRWSQKDGLSVWREKVEFTNGHYREASGALLHCSHGLRAIVRTPDLFGVAKYTDQIVVDRYQGRRLNSPNDVVVKSDGTIWFTDPQYGIASNHEGYQAQSELGTNYVFCFDPKTKVLEAVTDFIEDPNGLAFSADESVLYVSDTSAVRYPEGQGNHHIVQFDVLENNQLNNPRIFATINSGVPDGFRLDARGWVFSSSAEGVQVFHPDGGLLAKIMVPEKVGNLTFGGAKRDELYICASTSLYRIRLNAQGIQKG